MRYARFVMSGSFVLMSLLPRLTRGQLGPEDLPGEYRGVYRVTTGFQTSQPISYSDSITWIFTSNGYNMKVDTQGGAFLCSPFGTYTIGDSLTLSENGDGCSGVIGDGSLNPTGNFGIGGTSNWLVMNQVDTIDSVRKTIYVVRQGTCCFGARGNIDGSPEDPFGHIGIDIADLTYLVNWMFRDGPDPPCMEEANINGYGNGVDVADLTYTVQWMFKGDFPPPDCP